LVSKIVTINPDAHFFQFGKEHKITYVAHRLLVLRKIRKIYLKTPMHNNKKARINENLLEINMIHVKLIETFDVDIQNKPMR
jgi:hypothetical protein